MSSPDDYRTRAGELRSKARFAENRELAAEWVRLADSDLRLAEQSERNDKNDIVYEPPPPKLSGEV